MQKLGQSLYISIFWMSIALIGVAAVWGTQSFVASDEKVSNGQLSSSFEKYYNEHLPIRNFAISLWAAIRYRVFNEGNRGVVVGIGGALFTDEEFYEPSQPDSVLSENIESVAKVARRLDALGIPLVVVLVPAKVDVYREWLGDRQPSRYMQLLFQRAGSLMHDSGINTVDLRNTFIEHQGRTPLFLRNDTHWTPEGAELAAKFIADIVEKQTLLHGNKRFITEVKETVEHRGDLLNYLPLEPYFGYLLPEMDRLQIKETMPADEPMGDVINLFGDVDPGVALVGTSYSADERWNFEGALKHALSADVYNYATRGEGPFKPMEDFLQAGNWKDLPPELVLWEIPVRYIVAIR